MVNERAALKNFLVKPFEASVGIFVIMNAILTFFPESTVIQILTYQFGTAAFILPVFQIFAGLFKLVGIYLGKANIEAVGLIMVSTLFAARIATLLSDWDVDLVDINSITIGSLIITANSIKLHQLFKNMEIVVI
jgi:hypothetical protein